VKRGGGGGEGVERPCHCFTPVHVVPPLSLFPFLVVVGGTFYMGTDQPMLPRVSERRRKGRDGGREGGLKDAHARPYGLTRMLTLFFLPPLFKYSTGR